MAAGASIIFFIIILIIYRQDFRFMRKKELKIFLIFFLIYAAINSLCFFCYNLLFQKTGKKGCFIIVFLIQISLVIVQKILLSRILLWIKDLLEKNNELQLFLTKNKLEYQYYKIAGESVEEIHILRHEISNQLQTAYYLFSENDEKGKQEAMDIINDLQKGLSHITMVDYCDNTVINAIMTIKFAEAKKRGIHTEYEIGSIGHLVIGESDICSIFTNLFDNAMEACLNHPVSDNFICVRIYEKAGYLVIQFKNSFNGIVLEKDNQYMTTKKDKVHHGYGMKLLKAIVKKYDGEMRIEHHENEFTTTLYLKVNLIIY